jgi:hypothetical protein
MVSFLGCIRLFLHTKLVHVRCVCAALLHLNKQNGWTGQRTLWRVNRLVSFLFYMSVFKLTCLPVDCIFYVVALEKTGCLDKEMNSSVQQQRVMWYNLLKGIPSVSTN